MRDNGEKMEIHARERGLKSKKEKPRERVKFSRMCMQLSEVQRECIFGECHRRGSRLLSVIYRLRAEIFLYRCGGVWRSKRDF